MAKKQDAPETLPADFSFPDELPADFGGFDTAPPPVQPAPVAAQDVPWWQAAFPRSTERADLPAYDPRALLAAALDVASLPGRSYAALTRPEDESYGASMARLTAPETASGVWSATDAILRDPAAIVLAANPTVGAARGLVGAVSTGLQTGAQVAALRQAENAAANRPVQYSEMPFDAALGGGLGLGANLGGRAISSLQPFAGKYLTTVIDPTDKARRLGWDGLKALREVARESPAGYIPMTLGGLREAAAKGMSRRVGLRPEAILADETAAMARGYSPAAMVDLNQVSGAGRKALADQVASMEIAGASGHAPGAARWITKETQSEIPGYNAASIRQALNLRGGLDDFAFVPNASGISEAREIAAKAGRQEINRQLDRVAPRTRAVDAEIAPLASQMGGLGIVLDRRMNRDMLTTGDVLSGLAIRHATGGGPVGGFWGALGAAGQRLLRTPAPAALAYQAGRIGGAITRNPSVLPRVVLGARGTAPDATAVRAPYYHGRPLTPFRSGLAVAE